MTILILGAAGQIARLLTDELIQNTNHNIILYARNAGQRLRGEESDRVKVIDGDFKDRDSLIIAMKGVDLVYVNAMGDVEATASIVAAMNESGLSRIIVATILGIYDEVPGNFGKWNKQMVGNSRIKQQAESVSMVEVPTLNYTILRLTWLYNKSNRNQYMLTEKGIQFQGAQVTRQAVCQLIMDIIQDKSGRYHQTSLGVSEPDTNWDKPSFY